MRTSVLESTDFADREIATDMRTTYKASGTILTNKKN
jgi:hypothetical protein